MNRTSAKRTRARRPDGFTLIELMVTLAIGVLLMVVAVPSFVQFRKNADLSDAVSSFVMATTLAKSAALKTGRNTYIVPTDTSLGWRAGWYVYVDSDFNGSLNGTEQKIAEHAPLSTDITVTTPAAPTAAVPSTLGLTPGYLLYSGSGYPQQVGGGLAAGIIEMRTSVRASTILVDTTGRARSCITGSAGCTL